MSRRPRRNHSAAFKAKVAIEALADGKTIAEIAQKHDVHPNQEPEWRRQLMERAAGVFGGAVAPGIDIAEDAAIGGGFGGRQLRRHAALAQRDAIRRRARHGNRRTAAVIAGLRGKRRQRQRERGDQRAAGGERPHDAAAWAASADRKSCRSCHASALCASSASR